MLYGPSVTGGCPSENALAAHCAGQALGEPGLLAHLDECVACQMIAAALVQSDCNGSAVRPTPVSRPQTLAAGSLVAGRYQIQQLLGWGGMGEVYAAQDSQLNELVALKTLSIFKVDARELGQRLKGEAQLARRVTHPNVVRIFDFGTHSVAENNAAQTFLPFLTMELLNGQTLGQRIRSQQRLLTGDAVAIAIEVLAGLGAVHAAGIVHRDLKPDNIFLVAESGTHQERRTVLTDFGLAKTLDGLQSRQSQVGAIVGTLAYLSPEQIEGKQATVASDIYAFGVVLFEMLTGYLPGSSPGSSLFAGENGEASSQGVPKALFLIIRKCLARDPLRRYQNAKSVSGELDAVIKNEDFVQTKARLNGLRTKSIRKRAVIGGGVVMLLTPILIWAFRANFSSQVQGMHSTLSPISVGNVAAKNPLPPAPSAPLPTTFRATAKQEAKPERPPVPSSPPVRKRKAMARRTQDSEPQKQPVAPVSRPNVEIQQAPVDGTSLMAAPKRHPDDVIDPFTNKR